jgi:hypothetical protein
MGGRSLWEEGDDDLQSLVLMGFRGRHVIIGGPI